MPSNEAPSANSLPTGLLKSWSGQTENLAVEFYRLKVAHEAAGLAHLQEQRNSVLRLVQLNQNRAYGRAPDAGLPETTRMNGGGIHVGDVYLQHPPQPQPAGGMITMLPAPAPAANPLAKYLVGAAAAAAGLGAGLGLPALMKPSPTPIVEPAPLPSGQDTIGILELDKEG